jgi:hypothetical protein
MRNLIPRRLTAALFATAITATSASTHAVELLTNGNLESSVSPPGFTLTQTISELPGSNVSAIEQISFANNPPATPGELGLFIKPTSGNAGTYADQNQKIDITLTQTVNAVAGRTYTFKGDAQLADGYSGSVEFLDSLSPSDPEGTGTVPSPTETLFELAFLDASNAVLGTPTTLDLRDGLVVNTYQTRTLPAVVAPAGTARARVTASIIDAVANVGFQDVYFDNFSLRDATFPNSERLINGNLNNVGPPNGYEITELPAGADTLSFINFANHTPGGEQGMWLRAFAGTEAAPADGILSQTVPGMAGGAYTFSAWSFWEPGFSGDADTFPGTVTDTIIQMEFLNSSNVAIGSPISLDLDAAGQNNDSTWRQFSINGTAPAGTASVRVTAAGLKMFDSLTNPQSAFFDDLSLEGPAVTVADVDLDNDNDVDGNDLLLIQRGLGTTTTAADVAAWRTQFGSGGAAVAVGAVPEPVSVVAAALAAIATAAVGRRRDAE